MMDDDTWTEDPDFDSMFKILHNEYVAMKRLLFETGIVSGQKDARIAAIEAENAALRPLAEAVKELERQVLSGIEKDIFIGITDDIPPVVHLNFDWAGTLVECLIAEAWKENGEKAHAALIALAGELE
jgi:hypothetical protein